MASVRVVCEEMLKHAVGLLGQHDCVCEALAELLRMSDSDLLGAADVFRGVYMDGVREWHDAVVRDGDFELMVSDKPL